MTLESSEKVKEWFLEQLSHIIFQTEEEDDASAVDDENDEDDDNEYVFN